MKAHQSGRHILFSSEEKLLRVPTAYLDFYVPLYVLLDSLALPPPGPQLVRRHVHDERSAHRPIGDQPTRSLPRDDRFRARCTAARLQELAPHLTRIFVLANAQIAPTRRDCCRRHAVVEDRESPWRIHASAVREVGQGSRASAPLQPDVGRVHQEASAEAIDHYSGVRTVSVDCRQAVAV